MFVIGIGPHRGSHAAAALDEQEQVRSSLHSVCKTLPDPEVVRSRSDLIAYANDAVSVRDVQRAIDAGADRLTIEDPTVVRDAISSSVAEHRTLPDIEAR
jgi:hypothetical protein